jgi:hypothetical protein
VGGITGNVSYNACGLGNTQTNIDIGETIYKCVTYGTTPSQNSGTVDISPTSNPCNNDGDCIGGGGS